LINTKFLVQFSGIGGSIRPRFSPLATHLPNYTLSIYATLT